MKYWNPLLNKLFEFEIFHEDIPSDLQVQWKPITLQLFIKFHHNAMPPSTDVGAQTQNTTVRSITNSPVQTLSLES